MELKICTGQEFKVYIYEDSIIPNNCLFWDEYKKATVMLNNIILGFKISDETKSLETENQNNIIAFCGDRGAGKTSIMMNFCNAIKNIEKNANLGFDNVVKNAVFSDNILIDPSMFDTYHNIIDVIVANMFQKVVDYENSHKQNEITEEYHLILEKFQKVYKYLSLINDTKKILDDEFDYEGSIGKLSRLGESLELKEEMHKLVYIYLNFINKRDDIDKYLIIEVDDIDLCSENAYRMIEQIRKYLMIPNVIIMLAVRMEQLELCVQEKNLGDYPKLLSLEGSRIQNEIVQMTEKYLLKLIPEARRVYISGVRLFNYGPKLILDDHGEEKEYENTVDAVRVIIYKKTEILLLDEDLQLFIPNGLRGILNLIVYINQLNDFKENFSAIKNIEEIMNYIERVWLQDRKELDAETKLFISQLIKQDLRWMNESINSFCISKFKIDKEFFVQGLNGLVKLCNLDTNYDIKVTISAIRLVCIFKWNLERRLQKDKLIYVFRFNVWENNLRAAIGGDRYCISVNSLDTLKVLANRVSGRTLDSSWIYEGATEEKLNSRPKSMKDPEKSFWCEAMLYLLIHMQIDINKSIVVARTYGLMDSKVTIGFAHFLTNIQNMDGVKRYSGILNIFDKEIVDGAITKIKDEFFTLSNYLGWLYSNLGLFIYIQEKHTGRISYKGKASNKEIVKKLLKDISNLEVEDFFVALLKTKVNIEGIAIKEKEIENASEIYNSISSIKGQDLNEIERWQDDFKALVFGEKMAPQDGIVSVKKRFIINHKSYAVLKDRYDNVAHNFAIVAYKIKNYPESEKTIKLWAEYQTKFENKLLDLCEYYKEVCNHVVDDAMEEITESDIKLYLDFVKLWESINKEEWRV